MLACRNNRMKKKQKCSQNHWIKSTLKPAPHLEFQLNDWIYDIFVYVCCVAVFYYYSWKHPGWCTIFHMPLRTESFKWINPSPLQSMILVWPSNQANFPLYLRYYVVLTFLSQYRWVFTQHLLSLNRQVSLNSSSSQ